MKNND